jgi:uncharacterized membrane protein YbhN (UPF0104 family)
VRARIIALAGVLASGVFLWLAFRNLPLGAVAEAVAAARLWPWIPLALLTYLAGHGMRGLRLRRLLSLEADLPLGTATNIVVLGYGVNNILPARLGELARAGLLSDRMGMPFTQSLTVTLLERLLDGWVILLFFFAGTFLVALVDSAVLRTALGAAAVFGLVSAGMLLMIAFPRSVASLVSRAVGAVNSNWGPSISRRCLYVASGLAYLRRPGHALQIVLLSAAVWLLETGLFLFVMPAFALPVRVDWAILTMAVTNLGILVPSTPGFVGPFHYFCMQSLVVLGVTGVTASSYAITVHALFCIPITVWGLGVILRYGMELGRVTALAGDARKRTVTTVVHGISMAVLGTRRIQRASDRPGQLIVAITEALLPPAALDGSPYRTARFVQGQLNALPTSLRLLLSVGLCGFRVLVRLRYSQSFCALDPQTRRRVVSGWAYGRYAVARQLFRVLRSCALLHYYETVDKRRTSPVEADIVGLAR